ncbi:MAG: putative nucleotide-diphospho-sugar transferase [Mucilaginibacter sp.]
MSTGNKEPKIPLLTYYSPSHELLFEKHFYPSYLKHLSDDFELFVLKDQQTCDVVFRKGNWNKQVKEKVTYVNNFIQDTASDFFLFSDVDIIFYKNVKEDLLFEMYNVDIGFQSDNTKGQTDNLCSGFYCCRVNNKTKSFFNYLTNHYDNNQSDQQNFNLFLPKSDLNYKPLSNKFYNFSHSTGSIWHHGLKIPFPEFPIAMYHANYTVGNTNKEYLLQTFKEWDNKFFT